MKRRRIYEIIEVAGAEDRAKSAYDYSMIVVIVASLIPLAFKETTVFLGVLDKICVSVFILDYLLRWILSPLSRHSDGTARFAVYSAQLYYDYRRYPASENHPLAAGVPGTPCSENASVFPQHLSHRRCDTGAESAVVGCRFIGDWVYSDIRVGHIQCGAGFF